MGHKGVQRAKGPNACAGRSRHLIHTARFRHEHAVAKQTAGLARSRPARLHTLMQHLALSPASRPTHADLVGSRFSRKTLRKTLFLWSEVMCAKVNLFVLYLKHMARSGMCVIVFS